MAIYTMKEGTLEDREKLLESEDKEKVAEKLGLEIEELKTEEQLLEHLEENMDNQEVPGKENVAKMAAQHLRMALGDMEDRILYTELDEE